MKIPSLFLCNSHHFALSYFSFPNTMGEGDHLWDAWEIKGGPSKLLPNPVVAACSIVFVVKQISGRTAVPACQLVSYPI